MSGGAGVVAAVAALQIIQQRRRRKGGGAPPPPKGGMPEWIKAVLILVGCAIFAGSLIAALVFFDGHP